MSSDHSCGIRTDGTLTCWGANFYAETFPAEGEFLNTHPSAGDFEAITLSYQYPDDGVVEYTASSTTKPNVDMWGNLDEEVVTERTYVYEGTIRYQTSPGPAENTTRVGFDFDWDLLDVKEVLNGTTPKSEPIPREPGGTPDPDVVVVVDKQGNLLESPTKSINSLYNGGSFIGVSHNSVISDFLDRPFGPAFPDYPVGIGDAWTEVITLEELGGPVITTAKHYIQGIEDILGRRVLVVESEYRTEEFEWDLSDLMPGFMIAALEGQKDFEGIRESLPGYTMTIRVYSANLRAVTYFDPHAGLVVQGEFHEYGSTSQDMAAPIEGLSLILSFRESPTHQYTKSFPIHNEFLLYTHSSYQRDISYTSATPDQQLFTSCRSPQDCRATGVVGFHGLFMQFMGEHSNGLIFGLDQWPPPTTQEGTANTDLKVWYEDQPDVVWSPVEDPWQLLVDNGEWTRVEVNMPSRPEYLYVQWERPDGKTLLWKTMGMVRDRLFSNNDWVWPSTHLSAATRVADRICWAHWTGTADPHVLFPDPVNIFGDEPVPITRDMIDWVITEVCQ